MRKEQRTYPQGPPVKRNLEQMLYHLGLKRRVMGEAVVRKHQVGACGHRTTMDGYCWYCQSRTGRPPSLCRLNHANWPNERTCAVCGLPTTTQGANVVTVGLSGVRVHQGGERGQE